MVVGSSERPGGSVTTRAEPEMVVGSAAMRAAPARRVQREIAMGSSQMLGGSVVTVTRRSPKTATRREQRPGADFGHREHQGRPS